MLYIYFVIHTTLCEESKFLLHDTCTDELRWNNELHIYTMHYIETWSWVIN